MGRGSLICGTAAAATLILGFSPDAGFLARADGDDPALARDELPAWFRAALARIRARGGAGIAIVVPAEPALREPLARSLSALLESADPDVREVLAETVYVCVPARWVGAREGETAVLVGEDGSRLAGAGIRLDSQDAFAAGIRALLHGEDGGRLAKRAARERTPEVAKALDDLGAEGFGAREEAQAILARRFADCAAAVVERRLSTTDLEIRTRCRSIVEAHLGAQGDARAAARLPFGVEWQAAPPRPAEVECLRVAVRCERIAPAGPETGQFLKFLCR